MMVGIILSYTGGICLGILIGIFLGRKQKIKIYEILLDGWNQRCCDVLETSHNNTMMILEQLNEFYREMSDKKQRSETNEKTRIYETHRTFATKNRKT